MDSDHAVNTGEASSTRLILLSLVVPTSVVWIPSLLPGLLLIDIGETFGQPVGVVGQLFTVTRIVGVTIVEVIKHAYEASEMARREIRTQYS